MSSLSKILDPGKKTRRAAEQAAKDAQLRDFGFAGPGGSNVRFNVGSQTGSVDLGDLDPVRQAFIGNIFSQLGPSGPTGLEGVYGGSLADLSLMPAVPGQRNVPIPMSMQRMSPLPSVAQRSMNFGLPQAPGAINIFSSPEAFMPPQAGQRFGAGSAAQLEAAGLGNLNLLTQDPSEVGASRLNILRQLSAPEEQRAQQALETRLFSQGRLGSTGGALQTQALAEAQSRADLERQLAAQDYGRGIQQDALARAQTLLGEGRATTGLGEDITQNMFGRALATNQQRAALGAQSFEQQLAQAAQNLARQQTGFGQTLDAEQLREQMRQNMFGEGLSRAGLENTILGSRFGEQATSRSLEEEMLGNIFGQQMAGRDFLGRQAIDRFNLAKDMVGTREGIDQARFGRALASMGAVDQLQGMGLNQFNAALNAALARSNAMAGAAGNLSQIAASTPNPYMDLAAGFLSGVGPGKFNIFGKGQR